MESNVKFELSEKGPKNIALRVKNDWIQVTPNRAFYSDGCGGWVIEWELPEKDVESHGYYAFEIFYSPRDDYMSFSARFAEIHGEDIREQMQRVVNGEQLPSEEDYLLTEEDDD